jgi:hypothetical protein
MSAGRCTTVAVGSNAGAVGGGAGPGGAWRGACVAPHCPQKRAPSARGAPHCAQGVAISPGGSYAKRGAPSKRPRARAARMPLRGRERERAEGRRVGRAPRARVSER